MRTVTLGVSDGLEDAKRRLAGALDGQPQGHHLTFASVEQLWRTMTPRRWELLAALAGAAPSTLRGLARRVGRDVKTVHGDVHALLSAGLLERTDDGLIVFPYDSVHVDFRITAAA